MMAQARSKAASTEGVASTRSRWKRSSAPFQSRGSGSWPPPRFWRRASRRSLARKCFIDARRKARNRPCPAERFSRSRPRSRRSRKDWTRSSASSRPNPLAANEQVKRIPVDPAQLLQGLVRKRRGWPGRGDHQCPAGRGEVVGSATHGDGTGGIGFNVGDAWGGVVRSAIRRRRPSTSSRNRRAF